MRCSWGGNAGHASSKRFMPVGGWHIMLWIETCPVLLSSPSAGLLKVGWRWITRQSLLPLMCRIVYTDSGKGAFRYSAPYDWNSLLNILNSFDFFDAFKSILKRPGDRIVGVLVRDATKHWSGSIYRFSDQQSNIICAILIHIVIFKICIFFTFTWFVWLFLSKCTFTFKQC